PAPIGPGEVPARFRRQSLRHRIVAMGAAGATADDPCKSHPATGPEAVAPDGVAREFRAAWGMPAVATHEHREAVAIALDQDVARALEGIVDDHPEAAEKVAQAALPSILSSASATASKTSSVEVWRGRYSRTG